MKRGILIGLIGGTTAAIAILAWLVVAPGPSQTPTSEVEGTGTVSPGGPFTLTDGQGRTVTERDFRGKLMLVFFGFTHCPDVCPATLRNIAMTLEALGPEAERVAALFVTVDPERDDPRQMADYTRMFDPRIIGLTGTPEQIAEVAKKYGVYYEKVPFEGGDYAVNHTTLAYLMGPDGKLLTMIRPQTSPDDMAETIRSYLENE